MSASYILDLANTFNGGLSILPANASAPTSGVTIGFSVDLKDAGALTNVVVIGGASSGTLVVQVQTAPTFSGNLMSGGYPASGAFTDPTSGAVDFPSQVKSGGLIYINSGLVTLPGGGDVSGAMGLGTLPAGMNPNFNGQGGGGCCLAISGSVPLATSGGVLAFANFQRPSGDRFARLNILGLTSGFTAIVAGGVFGQDMTTGSGGGFTMSPVQSGKVVV